MASAAAPAQVDFHTGVAEPLGFACRLLRKAYRQGARVTVTASASTLTELDRLLWTFEERDFVPHLRVQPAQFDGAAAARTPIWLWQPADAEQWPALAPPVCLNLGTEMPPLTPPLQRVIEVVGLDAEQADLGRQRWREYKARGCTLVHHTASGAREA